MCVCVCVCLCVCVCVCVLRSTRPKREWTNCQGDSDYQISRMS